MYPFWPYWEGHTDRPGDDEDHDAGTVDTALARRVGEQLLQPPLLESGHLVVDVQNGVVILAGSLETREACDVAGQRAWATPGVRDVLNRLTVSPVRGRKKRK